MSGPSLVPALLRLGSPVKLESQNGQRHRAASFTANWAIATTKGNLPTIFLKVVYILQIAPLNRWMGVWEKHTLQGTEGWDRENLKMTELKGSTECRTYIQKHSSMVGLQPCNYRTWLAIRMELDGVIDGARFQDEQRWKKTRQRHHELSSIIHSCLPSTSLSVSDHTLLSSHMDFCHHCGRTHGTEKFVSARQFYAVGRVKTREALELRNRPL